VGRAGADSRLVVTAGSAGEARALARAFAAADAPGTTPFTARFEVTRAAWRASLTSGPLPTPTRGAEVAARLLGRARWGHVLAGELAVPDPEMHLPEPAAPVAVLDAWQDVTRAAHAADPAALAGALERAGSSEA